jgi:hypothetical protein
VPTGSFSVGKKRQGSSDLRGTGGQTLTIGGVERQSEATKHHDFKEGEGTVDLGTGEYRGGLSLLGMADDEAELGVGWRLAKQRGRGGGAPDAHGAAMAEQGGPHQGKE